MWTKSQKILLLSLISILFLLIPVFNSPDFSWDFHFLHLSPFIRSFISYCLLLCFFFAHHYYLQPRLFQQHSYKLYAGGILLAFIICSFLPILLIPSSHVHHELVPPKHPHHHAPHPDNLFLLLATQNIFQFLFIAIVSFSISWYSYFKRSEQARLDAELSNLKAQIQPHFLFNTLNNIYSLAISKSEQTPTAITQLSQMMRYLFGESSDKWVSLDNELAYIDNFIALQQLRLNSKTDFQYRVEGKAENEMRIAPLILIPFIENVFKHGVNPDMHCAISIDIQVSDKSLDLYTHNKIVNQNRSDIECSGVGIQNAKARLQYIYGDQYHLDIQTMANDHYSVHLKIPIFRS